MPRASLNVQDQAKADKTSNFLIPSIDLY